MKAKDIIITGEQGVKLLMDSFDLYKQGFRSHDEHMEVCRVLRSLFGEEAYDKVISQEAIKQATVKYPETQI